MWQPPDRLSRTSAPYPARQDGAPNQEVVMGQVVQLAGALLVLAAFALAQAGLLDGRSGRYLVANVAGACVLAVDAWLEGQLGFLVLEATWALVSALSLVTRRIGGRSTPCRAARSSGRAGR
jgi:hypothetical protein